MFNGHKVWTLVMVVSKFRAFNTMNKTQITHFQLRERRKNQRNLGLNWKVHLFWKEKINRTYPKLKHTFIISQRTFEMHFPLSKFCKPCILWKCGHFAVRCLWAILTFHERKVLKLLKGLRPNKATEPDEIQTFILKHSAESLAPYLTRIYQLSLDQGQIPDDWRRANIVPIYKKGRSFNHQITGQCPWHQ